jgi:hypothetical protein
VRAVIVYESMLGNTRLIAEAIADGLGAETDVRVIGVGDAGSGALEKCRPSRRRRSDARPEHVQADLPEGCPQPRA